MNTNSKFVLMIGLRSSAVDYEKWPEISPEKLKTAFKEVIAQMIEAGYQAEWCLTDTGETAEEQVSEALKARTPDIVLIAAGLRTDPDHLSLFVTILNLVRQHAPQAAIAFNTSPQDSLKAVQDVE